MQKKYRIRFIVNISGSERRHFYLLLEMRFAPIKSMLFLLVIFHGGCVILVRKHSYLKMDLLGSILNSMDKPPSCSDKQKLLRKSKD